MLMAVSSAAENGAAPVICAPIGGTCAMRHRQPPVAVETTLDAVRKSSL
ncbi:hypothetical protein [Deinococcus koreensis]|nr:hypothetical protein [Deinococcus koreensis]